MTVVSWGMCALVILTVTIGLVGIRRLRTQRAATR